MKHIVGLSNSNGFEKGLCKELKAKKINYTCEQFPDGELKIKFHEKIRGKEILLVQSLALKPNQSLIELYFAAKTAKKLKAKKIIAIIPYLAYMRQDKEFTPGECISAHHMAELLNNSIDELITIDPHLHRIRKMEEVFTIPAKAVTSTDAIAEFVEKKFDAKNTVIIGPDWESFQWARKVAKKIGFQSIIFSKHRFSARRVKVKYNTNTELKGKKLILIDDMISTGHTMIETIKELKKKKPKEIYCVTVHALLVENAHKKLKKAGTNAIYSCNTVPSKTNTIDVSKIVAKEIQKK
jgi:ribose-phosphate pyrophosphokinase